MNKLLFSIIEQLRDRQAGYAKAYKDSDFRKPRRELRVDYIDAVFFAGRKRLGSINVVEALAYLAEDVHIFAEFDLHDATRVTLKDN